MIFISFSFLGFIGCLLVRSFLCLRLFIGFCFHSEVFRLFFFFTQPFPPPVVTFPCAASFVAIAFSFPTVALRKYRLVALRMSVILGKRARSATTPTVIALDAMALAHQKAGNSIRPLSMPEFRHLAGVGSDIRVIDMRDGGVFGDSEIRDVPKMRKLGN